MKEKEEKLEVEGEVIEALRSRMFRVRLDNGHEAQRLSKLLAGRTQRVLLRVTPGVDADTHEAILTGQAGSKFGFAPGDAAALIAQPPPGLHVAGLHMHLGSQLFALEPYRTVLQMTSTVEAELPPERPFTDVLRALFPCGSITGVVR